MDNPGMAQWPSEKVMVRLSSWVTNPIIELHTWQSKYCRLGHATFVCVYLWRKSHESMQQNADFASQPQDISFKSCQIKAIATTCELKLWCCISDHTKVTVTATTNSENNVKTINTTHELIIHDAWKNRTNLTWTSPEQITRRSSETVWHLFPLFIRISERSFFRPLDQWLKGERMKHQFKTKVTNLQQNRLVSVSQFLKDYPNDTGRKWWSPKWSPKKTIRSLDLASRHANCQVGGVLTYRYHLIDGDTNRHRLDVHK